MQHRVHVTIKDQIATTMVEQEFYNPNPSRLEGTYLFPVPKGTHLDRFTMEIAGKPVEAELLPADRARKIYEDIVRRAKDPALLEYADRDVFKVRIFPIEGHENKRVTLRFTQLLQSDSSLVGYTYPLRAENFSARPTRALSLRVELETGLPLKAVYSPSHVVEVKREGSHRATVGFEARAPQADLDFTLYFASEKDPVGTHLLAHRPPGEDGFFLLLMAPGHDAGATRVLPKDVVFVLDTSGSMAGKKLDQAKSALRFCVENLQPDDRFEIVRFATEVEPLFDRLVAANRPNRARAGEFIEGLSAIGGTAIDDALRAALELKTRSADAMPDSARLFVILFLTDGRPTIGTTDEAAILANVKRAHPEGTRIFCFGIGTDVNTHLLDKIAAQTRAAAQYVLPDEDLEVKVSHFFAKINEPVLANPTLRFTGAVRVTQLHPWPLPDLFHGDQLALVGRYAGQGECGIALEGVIRGRRRTLTREVCFPSAAPGHDFLPRLWATRRVGYLLDEIRLHGENAEVKDEVTRVARQYGIVTPYTAYLIVEDEERRGVPLQVQSLPQLNRDDAARREAAVNWSAFQREQTGERAVAAARYGLCQRAADAPAVAAAAGALEANRALGLPTLPPRGPATPAPDPRVRLVQYAQQSQFVAGRNFFRQENQWVDANLQAVASAPRQRIQFASPEYFAFAATHSRALPWLALGKNVQFTLDGVLYEIHE